MGFDYNSLLAFIIFGVTIGVVYGIVALGISLIYSGLDIVHFAHGEMYMFGAFFGLVLAHNVDRMRWQAAGLLGVGDVARYDVRV